MAFSIQLGNKYLFHLALFLFNDGTIDNWIRINVSDFQILKIASTKNKYGWWIGFMGYKKIFFRNILKG
jgi:hypothetical protein